jgi:cytochrome d ubiquinol oxidase subunit II
MLARYWRAWFASCVTIVLIVFFGLFGIFPDMLISSINPAYTLNAFNSSSSPLTLKIMLGVVAVFVPVVIGYQTWVYFLFRDKASNLDY